MTLDKTQYRSPWQRIDIPQSDPPLPPSETLPDMYALPSEEVGEPGLPDEYHSLQPTLLSHTFRPRGYFPQNLFTGTDMNLYYDARYPRRYKRPDWFAVVGVPRLYRGVDLRMSYVRWYEGVDPFVVIEFLSPGTEADDLGPYAATTTDSAYEFQELTPTLDGHSTNGVEEPPPGVDPIPDKWVVYERILKVPYYFTFSRYSDQLRYFKLIGGHYQEQRLNSANPLAWLEELEIGLGLWDGTYEGVTRLWLRWCDRDGNWLPTDTELAEQLAAQEAQRAEQEAQRAEQEAQRAEQAIAQLRQVVQRLHQQGLAPEAISELTGLSIADIERYRH
ncbi:MAG: Uma2 family endonuclease [Cyanobacteriota bacterium SKYGB_h_bin112]|nr:Uma2 family endonuclease [Cyanobacteriota bacterium SKYGB_h_bin112]